MIKSLKSLLILGGVMLVGSLLDYLMKYPDRLIAQILPNSVARLSAEHFKGLGMTFLASLFAWAAAVGVGYSLGMLSACAVVDKKTWPPLRRLGRAVDRFYEVIWVVPFVLTISLAFAIGMRMHTDDGLPREIVGVTLIAVCGIVLGGFQVYRSIYHAVNDAKDEDRYLVLSLYSLFGQRTGARFWYPLCNAWVRARRLRDCEIRQFREAIITSFFLSLVAVMILEMVTPSVYEWLLPQSGIAHKWLGGAGRQILEAQQNYSYEKIAGVIWIVIGFTWTVGYLVHAVTDRLWLKYYGGRP